MSQAFLIYDSDSDMRVGMAGKKPQENASGITKSGHIHVLSASYHAAAFEEIA